MLMGMQYSTGQINMSEIEDREGKDQQIAQNMDVSNISDLRKMPLKRKITHEDNSFNKKRRLDDNFELPVSSLDENTSRNNEFYSRILDDDEKFINSEMADSKNCMTSSLEEENPANDFQIKLQYDTSSISDMCHEITFRDSPDETENATVTKEQDQLELKTFLGENLEDMTLNNDNIQFILPSIAVHQCIENNEPFLIPKEHLINFDDLKKIIGSEAESLDDLFNPTSMHPENLVIKKVIPYDSGTNNFRFCDIEQNVDPEEVVSNENTLNGKRRTSSQEIAGKMSSDDTATMCFVPSVTEDQNVTYKEVLPFGITTDDSTLLLNDSEITSINPQIFEITRTVDAGKDHFRTPNSSNNVEQNESHEEAFPFNEVNDTRLNDIEPASISENTSTKRSEAQNLRTSGSEERNVSGKNVLPFMAIDEAAFMSNDVDITSSMNLQIAEETGTEDAEIQNLETPERREQNAYHKNVLRVDETMLMLNDEDITSSISLKSLEEKCSNNTEIRNLRTSDDGENICHENVLPFKAVDERTLMLTEDGKSNINLKTTKETITYGNETQNYRTFNNEERNVCYDNALSMDIVDSICEKTTFLQNSINECNKINNNSEAKRESMESILERDSDVEVDSETYCYQVDKPMILDEEYIETLPASDCLKNTESSKECSVTDNSEKNHDGNERNNMMENGNYEILTDEILQPVAFKTVSESSDSNTMPNSKSDHIPITINQGAVDQSSDTSCNIESFDNRQTENENSRLSTQESMPIDAALPKQTILSGKCVTSDHLSDHERLSSPSVNAIKSESINIPSTINQGAVDQSLDTSCNVESENSRLDIEECKSVDFAQPKQTILSGKCLTPDHLSDYERPASPTVNAVKSESINIPPEVNQGAVDQLSDTSCNDENANSRFDIEECMPINVSLPKQTILSGQFLTFDHERPDSPTVNAVKSESINISPAVNQEAMDQLSDFSYNIGSENSRFDIEECMPIDVALPKQTILSGQFLTSDNLPDHERSDSPTVNAVKSESMNIPLAVNQESVDELSDISCNVDNFDNRQSENEYSRFGIQECMSTDAPVQKQTKLKVKRSTSDHPSESCPNSLPPIPQKSRNVSNMRSNTSNSSKPCTVSEKLAIRQLLQEYLKILKEQEEFSVQDALNFITPNVQSLPSSFVVVSIRSNLSDYIKKGIVMCQKNGKYKIKGDSMDTLMSMSPKVEEKRSRIKKRVTKNRPTENITVEDNLQVTSSPGK